MRYFQSATVIIEDVIGGNLSLMECMLRHGIDCSGMVKHIRFLVEKSKVRSSQALVGYDFEVRERAEVFGPSVFCDGDHKLTHGWLGVEWLRSSTTTTSTSCQKQSKARKGFGIILCWMWNDSKPCKQIPCRFKHVCSQCNGDHKFPDCASKSGSSIATASKGNS